MMDQRRALNRSMFWRVIRRMVSANRGRLFVILLALGAGSAVTAALLNLQVDAKRRIDKDFGVFGPRAVIKPRTGDTMPESILDQLHHGGALAWAKGSLFLIGRAAVTRRSADGMPVVIGGFRGLDPTGKTVAPASENQPSTGEQRCIVGGRAADRLKVEVNDEIVLKNGDREETCTVVLIWRSGDAEDDQIRPALAVAQRLAGMTGQLSSIEIALHGERAEQDFFIEDLQRRFPDLEVRPLRQFSQAQIKVYQKISGVLTGTVIVVLVLTALCVMAAMTNIAAERKNDVGLMKAIGGSARRVLRIFLAEAALLGFVAGLLGAAAGILLSIGLGKAVFGVAALPRLVVYPVSVVLTVIVAILAAYPLRRLANIRPASVFRAEE
jgi:putative ABC transport system permease protein